MWTLDNALPLIRKISPIARRHGFSVALYGSVLDQGESQKDLDLFFIERRPDTEDSIVFHAAVDCVICFEPKDVFGSHIRLRQGINGGYTPSKVVAVGASYTVSFEILPKGQHCKDDMKIKAYSIKVG